MMKNEDTPSLLSYGVNGIAGLFNGALIFIGSIEPSTWGVIFGIIFGGITAGVNIWYKRKLLSAVEAGGTVTL